MASRLPRLYKRVSVGAGNNGGWIVALDDKPIKTPAKKLLELPTRPLAVGIAAEWEAQPRKIVPYTMQLMKLATTAIDQVPTIAPTMKDSMLRYLETDGACIRSDEKDLARKEAAHFDRLLKLRRKLSEAEWLHRDLDLPLSTTDSLTLRHPPTARARAQQILDSASDWELAALDVLTSTCKSFVLALAVSHGQLDAESACKASRVSEQHQIDQWGEVEAGHDMDAADTALRVASSSAFLQLLRHKID